MNEKRIKKIAKSRTSGTNLWFRRRQWSNKNDFLNRGKEKKNPVMGLLERTIEMYTIILLFFTKNCEPCLTARNLLYLVVFRVLIVAFHRCN